ncbi:tetratricopeptide repeat protein [Sinisalibacter aestuarii]|uniref:Sel1 repeat family protein n=1 Tax=Sinisalibacter aestuarii TaxID=2949426 RepID=A0ABQ5LQP9_9RHOB|nr:tetratricopeptide repeat protein [Sinisalibacter aestuarii]GKY87316.1 hypothetical protein STA1M1_11850 [Sinisalibacter aestuarii]
MKGFGLAFAAVVIVPLAASGQAADDAPSEVPPAAVAGVPVSGDATSQGNVSLTEPDQAASQEGELAATAGEASGPGPAADGGDGDAIATEPEAAREEAMPDTPVAEMAEAEAAPAPDPDIELCRTTAGPASAGVPAGASQAASRRAALAAGAQACTAAARAEDAPADVLFLAAEIAQGRRDLAGAFALLERAAAHGFGPAETRLGDYFLFGLAPGGEDAPQAIAHYEAAVALGDAPGMTTLALMHRVGKGVPRDPARMVTLLEGAAEAGYHFAQYRLAETYLTGEGIPGRRDAALGIPDPARAAALYTRAAEAGNITAALELAALYGDPASGLPDNPGERARLTLMASRAGLAEATAAMAVLYETGQGVEKDPGVAALLYIRALESGEVSFEALRKGAPARWDFDTAVAFQKVLQERGLYTGALDGMIGPGSAAAARALAGN